MKAFVIDLSVCNGCYCCQIACKDEHAGNDWTPYAKPQPDTGQFWLGIKETVRGTVPKVMVSYLPKMCMHCEDAPCMNECEVEGAIYKRDDGLIIIDPEKCTGCQQCVKTCPYGAIFFNETLRLAQKCTGCAHLLDDGWNEPRCVDVCPTGALKFGEASELKDLIENSDTFRPELEFRTKVYYLHLPGKFVAGTLYDPVEKEVVIGAKCTLTDTASGEIFEAKTDHFGDFWFRDMKDDRAFSLGIEKDGKTKTIEGISTEKDINLGDIPFE